MYDNDANQLSKECLTEQISYIKQCFPFIRQITIVDSDGDNMRTDYLCGVDAFAIDDNANTYKIQFKARKPDNNDIVLTATALTGVAANENERLGFLYNGKKYTFLVNSDIYCEKLGDGRIINFRGSDVRSLEAGNISKRITGLYPKKIFTDDHQPVAINEYYVFIPVESFMECKKIIGELENRQYYGI
jgi:hypothetical protein